MISENNKDRCCACGACAAICPMNAIKLSPDEYGNYYPVVDENCIECGKCDEVCNYKRKHTYLTPLDIYAARLKDQCLIRNSASGGAFVGIAMGFLDKYKDSVVYGCGYSDCMQPVHFGVEDKSQLKLFQGSKYTRSEIHVYEEISNYLKAGRKVLFTGTPCQCEAARLYNKNNENLYTIELICHGIVDIEYWKDYVIYLQKVKKGKLKSFTFRSKDKQLKFVCKYKVETHNLLKKVKQKDFYETEATSYYYNHFLGGYIFRENCYDCPFAREERCADITIGDYWGYKGDIPQASEGISAIIVNSQKGKELFNASIKNFIYERTSFEDVSRCNEQLLKPFDVAKKNYKMLEEWKANGAGYLSKQHHRRHWKAYIASKIGVIR